MLVIVEDETTLHDHLKKNFEREGYSVVSLYDYKEFEKYIETGNDKPCVFILDRFMNGSDTATRIRDLKAKMSKAKVLVLSAVGGPIEKGRILDDGADDYVSKPFSIEELSARVRVLRRQKGSGSEHVVKLGNVIVNLLNQSVDVGGSPLSISRKEYLLLKLFLQSPSRMFSRTQLLSQIWSISNDIETNVVEVTVKNLRKKLEGAGARVAIQSKRFLGYWAEIVSDI